MANRPGAGSLYERVGFEERLSQNPDSPADYGNTEDAWTERFERRAEFIHLRGGEDVQAARLEGRHVQVIRVRADSETRTITTDWRAVDQRTGAVFNVRDASQSDDRQWIDLLCEKGVAT